MTILERYNNVRNSYEALIAKQIKIQDEILTQHVFYPDPNKANVLHPADERITLSGITHIYMSDKDYSEYKRMCEEAFEAEGCAITDELLHEVFETNKALIETMLPTLPQEKQKKLTEDIPDFETNWAHAYGLASRISFLLNEN